MMTSRLPQTAACALFLLTTAGLAAGTAQYSTAYAGLRAEVLLDNPRVLVERVVLQPGQSTGRHTHPADQLLVFIRGGVLKSVATGRATLWRDGRVLWQSAGDRTDDGSSNAGATPIVMICVTLKPIPVAAPPSAAPGGEPQDESLDYPNIPGEDLLENNRVIVQRFTVNPGQWEGVHAHRPNMLYIHVRGGQWAARSKREPQHAYPERSPDGGVGWMRTVDISEGHESGNVGTEPIDLIWLTLKD